MPHAEIKVILQDKDGSIWFGTDGGGIGRIRGDRVETLTTANGLPGESRARRCTRIAKAVSGSAPSRAARSGCATAPPRRSAGTRACPGTWSGRCSRIGPAASSSASMAPASPSARADGTFTTDPALERLRTASIRALVRRRRGRRADRLQRRTVPAARRRPDARARPVVPSVAQTSEACCGIGRAASGSAPIAASRASTAPRCTRDQPGVEQAAGRSSPRSIRTSRTRCGSAPWPAD